MIERILSGKKITLKKNLSWDDVNVWCDNFQSAGLKTEFALELNPEAFRLGFTKVDNFNNNSANNTPHITTSSEAEETNPTNFVQTDAKPQRWIFNGNLLVSKIVTTTGSVEISAGKGNDSSNKILSSHSLYWNPIFLFALSLIISISLQTYLIRVMIAYFGWSTLATVMGIILLVVLPLAIARFIQPRSALSITLAEKDANNSSKQLLLMELPSYFIGKRNYVIYDHEGAAIGKVRRENSKATMQSITGNLIYQWDKEVDVQQEQEGAVSNVSDVFTDDTLWGELLDNIGWLKTIRQLKLRTPKIGELEFNAQQGNAICDENGSLVAIFYTHPMPALEFIKPGLSAIENFKIALFSLTLIRSGWL